MGLSKVDKTTLEEIIDDAISHIPRETATFDNSKVRKLMGIYDLKEFLFGVVYGEITTHFGNYYSSRYDKIPDKSEVGEIIDILTDKLKEIKLVIKKEFE